MYLKQGVPVEGAAPGAVVAVQTFGDFLNFNPHLHIIATDGCFYDQDGFMVGPQPDPKALEHAFRLEVFKMFKKESKISDAVIDNMLNWLGNGFNIFCSRPTDPDDQNGLERLAQYIIRTPISQERMVDVIKKTLQHLDLWETRNHGPPPGKLLLEFVPENELHSEQFAFAGDLKYPDLDNHHNNRYEDDYSQLPAEELCLKHASYR